MLITSLIALLPAQSLATGLVFAAPNADAFVWGMLAIVVAGALLWSWAWSCRHQPSEPHKKPRFPRTHI